MTCVVGVVTKDTVILGSDSAGSSKNVVETYKTNKLLRSKTANGFDIIFGFQGSYRVGDILKYAITIPKIRKGNVEEDLVTKFAPTLQEYIAEETDNIGSFDFLIGVHNRLFLCQSDFSILEPENGYTAIGSGIEYALGSLYTMQYSDMHPAKKVQKAIEAARHFSPTVDGPTRIIEL